jgi:predicted amidohydrolase
LDIAVREGASIILLPELCLDERAERDVVSWFRENRSVSLLLAGSRHLERADEPRRNRARVLLRGMRDDDILFHDKFSNFSIHLAGHHRAEWIERPNELTIVSGRDWSFAGLICKDFMETTTRRLLCDLRTRAVLVASMSPKSDLYVTDAAGLAQDAQAVVFVCNAPHDLADDTAILARPLRKSPPAVADQAPNGIVARTSLTNDYFVVFPIH